MFSRVQLLIYPEAFGEWKQLLLLYLFLSLYVPLFRHKLSSIVSSCFAVDKFFTPSLGRLIFPYEVLGVWSTKFCNVVPKFLDAVEKINIGRSFSLHSRALCIFTSWVLLIPSVLPTSSFTETSKTHLLAIWDSCNREQEGNLLLGVTVWNLVYSYRYNSM